MAGAAKSAIEAVPLHNISARKAVRPRRDRETFWLVITRYSLA
jgi:hypothetical protein